MDDKKPDAKIIKLTKPVPSKNLISVFKDLKNLDLLLDDFFTAKDEPFSDDEK